MSATLSGGIMDRFALLGTLLVSTMLVGGCGDAAGDGDGAVDMVETVDPRCEALGPSCQTRQQGCVIDATTDTAVCQACPAGAYPSGAGAACVPLSGASQVHDFGELTLAAGEEIGSLCQTWVLNNDTEIWVNAVEMGNTGYYHHSNWFFVPEDYKGWTTDNWRDCYSDGFSEIDAALAGGVLYAQSTQVRQEVQKFAAGAAVRIPPRSRIIGATHLLNFNPEPVSTRLELTLWTMPRDEVEVALVPFQLVYGDLAIPPQQRSVVRSSCDLNSAFSNLFDRPLELKLHYALPHYHALGDAFSLSIVGGPRDGEVLVDLGAYNDAEPFGFVFDPPIDLAGADGLAFSCGFDNPRDEVVTWGIGDQEMCEMLGFMESPMAFSAQVSETTTIDEGAIVEHAGPCNVLAFPFDPFK